MMSKGRAFKKKVKKYFITKSKGKARGQPLNSLRSDIKTSFAVSRPWRRWPSLPRPMHLFEILKPLRGKPHHSLAPYALRLLVPYVDAHSGIIHTIF